jgi:hypothetical protein
VPALKQNRWHPCLLPDDYLKKLRQDLAESDAVAESKTRFVPDSDATPPDDDPANSPS